MAKWTKEKAEGKIPVDQVEELLNGMWPRAFTLTLLPLSSSRHINRLFTDPDILPVSSPHNANLWKLLAHEDERITSADQTIAILEAMKLEIKVPAGEEAVEGTVEKILVREGEVVGAGARLMLVRKK